MEKHIARPETEQKRITLNRLLPDDAAKLKKVIEGFLTENVPWLTA